MTHEHGNDEYLDRFYMNDLGIKLKGFALKV